ncbi:MAG: hypothetical protein AAF657_40540, partial [Acidobacteriota bacterium]
MTQFALPALRRVAIPVATFLALAAFTWTQFDPAGRSESTFLTLLTSSLLAVIVALDARAKTVSSLSIPAAT